MVEIWKTIEEALYCEVSNLGNVRTKDRDIIISDGKIRHYKAKNIAKNKKQTGYLEVALPVEKGKRIYRTIHRLVLMTFNPIDNMDKLEVNHIDENKENNSLENLEWVTSKENCNYGDRNNKVSKNGLRYEVYCKELDKTFYSQKEAAEYIGVTPATMSEYTSGKKNPKNGYHWERIGGYNYGN